MSITVPIKCKCGKVKGEVYDVSADTGNHIVCMCIDCQTYAHYLEREELLDKCGGSHIYQTTPNKVCIKEGSENIQSFRQSPKGAVRFFAKCCNSPLANTVNLKTSFSGLSLALFDFAATGKTKEEVIGPVKYYCMSKYAKIAPENESHKEFPKSLTLKIIAKVLLGKLTKSYLPNSFYNEETGKPKGDTIILSKEDRAKLREKARV